MKKKIAITGGIGSGKSTLVQLIREIGYDVYSCDAIYQTIINNKDYIDKIAKHFPTAIRDGKIQKNILAEIVFSDSSAREKLNSIAHPLVMRELEKRMDESCGDFVFAEVPLLFEGNLEEKFDQIIVVMKNDEKRIQAVVQRDNISSEQVRKRIHAQINYQSSAMKERLRQCNAFIMYNDGDVSELKEQLFAFFDNQKSQP